MNNVRILPPALITDMAIASSLGYSRASVDERLRNRKTGVTHQHRFEQWTEAPLGVMDLHEFSCSANPVNEPDSATYQVISGLIDQIAKSSGLFARYAPREIGLLLGTTTLGLQGVHSRCPEI
jgi:hypothetical protein